jgi:hypothetical protein
MQKNRIEVIKILFAKFNKSQLNKINIGLSKCFQNKHHLLLEPSIQIIKEFKILTTKNCTLNNFQSFPISINKQINVLGEIVEYNKLNEKLNGKELNKNFLIINNYIGKLKSIAVSNSIVERSHSIRKLIQEKRMHLSNTKLNEILFIKYNK